MQSCLCSVCYVSNAMLPMLTVVRTNRMSPAIVTRIAAVMLPQIGHMLNDAAPGYVADSGTYALIGSAALLGGMASEY